MRPNSITDKMAVAAALLLTAGMAVFQALLALGVPLGHVAWGGQYETLPLGLRVASGINIVIYVWLFTSVLRTSGLSQLGNPKVTRLSLKIFGYFLILGVFMNAISRSHAEQIIMTPIALALCLSLLHIAYRAPKLKGEK